MLSLNELKELAEAQPKWSHKVKTNRFGSQEIGIEMGGGVWHWFEVSADGVNLFFDHSYSQNNGAIKKGVMYGMNLEDRIVKAYKKYKARS